MNYSFNADYREVAKRMHIRTNMQLFSVGHWKHLFLFKKLFKWPWC